MKKTLGQTIRKMISTENDWNQRDIIKNRLNNIKLLTKMGKICDMS